MTRINSNIPSVIAQANLAKTNNELEMRLQRLSTGLRINRAADDPTGLIISERLRSEIQGNEQGVKNSERTSSVIATAEGALAEVNDLLNSIKALVVEAANTGAFSEAEIEANQRQIDSAIESITRISNTASFGGLKLLNGSLDYTLSGLDTSTISTARVGGASFIGEASLEVDVDVVASAQTASLYIRGDLPTPGAPENGTILSTTNLRIAGPRGVIELQFVSATPYADMAAAINKVSALTGVEAALINNDATSGLVFRSELYGSAQFVSVERTNGPTDSSLNTFSTYSITNNGAVPGPPFPWADIGTFLTINNRDEGKDVVALINGALASSKGLMVSVRSPLLSVEILLTAAFATDPTLTSSAFNITGGGALFQLGSQVTSQQQANLGIPSVAASLLGGTLTDGQLQFLSSLRTGEANSLAKSNSRKDFSVTSDVLEASIDQVSVLRGTLGAFERNVIQTNVRSLQAAYENLAASMSRIRDADFAFETSQLTRSQILTSAGTSVLALANQQSQQVLQLLG
ncbi:flagellin N-terminal helical domain-containing protein [Nodularia spumigena]|uniref:flagellin N-terminal helical domain-containing protein n=1 Tax=Nodularia spumigena TaxID=70799 RepID=UPI002B200B0B|nr:flagellin [Nodularia spumigena]MEA5557594.1 flagellin [Nodularia spumigena CH309]